jgi:TPR repeat protein
MAISLLCLVALGCASEPAARDSRPQRAEAGAAESVARAIDGLKTAAEAGDPEAQSELAFAYQAGRGVPADQAAGVAWHGKAAKQGVVASQAALGRCLLRGVGARPQPIRGVHLLRQAALAGEPNAQALLGATFLHGYGRRMIRPDDDKAEKWLLAASEQGVAQAKFDLATLYFRMDENEQGLAWLREAVDQDHPEAHTLLSTIYREGLGVPQDEKESMRLLRRAARLEDPEGQNAYGVALRDGTRVESDAQQSFQWFEKAAWGDYTEAQLNLGLAYVHGIGVERDQVRGVAWLEVCRDVTYRGAIRALGSARDGLTREQLEAAEQLHREIAASLDARAAVACATATNLPSWFRCGPIRPRR